MAMTLMLFKEDMMGLLGGFVILNPNKTKVNKDYLLLMQEWHLVGLKDKNNMILKNIFFFKKLINNHTIKI
ncbi:hypothetical protein [Clostridium sp.]|uniref:hypothetical protein n=1 Tax=Clostridium sp. TaxID=1506 RepID=UPI00262419D7|nr:hypothetical protein [Clostridium sp.]